MMTIKRTLLFFYLLFTSCILCCPLYAQSAQEPIFEQLLTLDSLLSINKYEAVKKGLKDFSPEQISEKDTPSKVLYYRMLGELKENESKQEESIVAYEHLLEISSESLDTKIALIQAKGINDLGIAYAQIGELEKAKRAHFQSLALYNKYNDPQGGSFNYGNLSIIYKELKQLDSALYCLGEATKMAKLAQDTLGMGYHSLSHGILLIDNNEPVDGLAELNYAFHIFHLMKNEKMKQYTNRIRAGAYKSINDYSTAQSLLFTSRAYYQSVGDTKRLGQTDLSLAEVYFHLQELDSGYQFVQEGIEAFDSVRYVKGLVKGYHLFGEYYARKNSYGQAIKNYKKSLTLSENKYKGMMANSLLAMGSIYLQQGKINEAQKYAKEAFKVSNGSLSEGSERNYYDVMYETSKKQGNIREALHYLEILDQKKSETFNQERANEIARIEYKSKLILEKERLEMEKRQAFENLQNELAREQIILQAIIVGVVLILIILFVLYRSYQLKKQANLNLVRKNVEINELRISEKELAEETLALKERELATTTMLSHERNTLLEQLNEQITALSGKVDETIVPEVKEIKKTIKLNLSEDSWQSFTYQFEKVHPRFFDKLKTRYPSLTQRDLKICAYLRVGMERKEIATVSNMSPEAVKKSLYRIKKKMELTAEENLREFVIAI
ncbi:tetratricopeptide repeat protein [Flammeovirga sp. SubArs3]|uniref:tetratricopeptide repeat protein n=1 Tax=Flammeovirga sp. SubArs3 TaxID=2995316 RepID=UPI00248CE91F|nr:tetratricopeptide repeat protein [Flammeovirga sp. SubArs3]